MGINREIYILQSDSALYVRFLIEEDTLPLYHSLFCIQCYKRCSQDYDGIM